MLRSPCLGSLAFLHAPSFPLPLPSCSCTEHSTYTSTDSSPPGSDRVPVAACGAGEPRQEVTVLGGQLTPQPLPQQDLYMRTQIVQTEAVLFPQLANALALT